MSYLRTTAFPRVVRLLNEPQRIPPFARTGREILLHVDAHCSPFHRLRYRWSLRRRAPAWKQHQLRWSAAARARSWRDAPGWWYCDTCGAFNPRTVTRACGECGEIPRAA